MKRTIEIKAGGMVYYKGHFLTSMYPSIRQGFGMWRLGHYKITIKSGNAYYFKRDVFNRYEVIDKENKEHKGTVCGHRFRKFFFEPLEHKFYDITVKKVK